MLKGHNDFSAHISFQDGDARRLVLGAHGVGQHFLHHLSCQKVMTVQ